MVDLATAIAPECELEVVGIRPGEKLHEAMITADDARSTVEYDDFFVIQPIHPWWDETAFLDRSGGKACSEGFVYSSDKNDRWLSVDALRDMVEDL